MRMRSFGVLTGTKSAAVAGRIPLIDVASRRLRTWAPLAFAAGGCQFCLGTFVDNPFTTGSDPLSLQDVEVALKQRAGV